jgi:hypothetical protein
MPRDPLRSVGALRWAACLCAVLLAACDAGQHLQSSPGPQGVTSSDAGPPDAGLVADGGPVHGGLEPDAGGVAQDGGGQQDGGVGSGDAGLCTPRLCPEELATVLRGIQWGDGGYFRLQEWRSPDLPQAIVVEATAAFAVCVNGTASLPNTCDPWVFDNFATYDYHGVGTNGGAVYTVDATSVAHRLEFSASITNGTCWDVSYARMDGLPAFLTFQTWSLETLITCGVTSEPLFAVPPFSCQ